MTIRPIETERDAPEVVSLLQETDPTKVVDIAAYLHRDRTTPERADRRTWAAVVDGRIVGRVLVMRNFFTAGSTKAVFEVLVREAYRGRGIGGSLYETGLSYAGEIGVDGLMAKFHESDAGTAFAKRRGFELARAEAKSVLDPAKVTELPPADLDLRPVADVDPRLVYQVDLESSLDIPQIEQMDDIPYDEWVGHVLEYPQFTAEGSFCAMVDGVAAATSFLIVNRETGRAANMFTGTLRAYRGRGLARAVKLATTHWAAANGVTQIFTNNDETNAAMLAINRSLGYRPAGREVEWLKELPSQAR
jgi:GNAT superfamily N-acetyltransferase